MQDGATPQTANVVIDFLHETFNENVISYRFPIKVSHVDRTGPQIALICDLFH